MSLASQYNFVYATAPYGTSSSALWVRDPPGGKGTSTPTDANYADQSFALLDSIVAAQGPFHGILGYSQGSAFIPVYLAHLGAAASTTFQIAIMFCGYLPTTHAGLLGLVNAKHPFGGIKAMVWMGTSDSIITNEMTIEQATKFTNPIILTETGGAHSLPTSASSTFSDVIAFIKSNGLRSTTYAPTAASTAATTAAPTAAPDSPTQAPTPAPTPELPIVVIVAGALVTTVCCYLRKKYTHSGLSETQLFRANRMIII